MQIHNGRFAGKIEGDFVIFLIGMRINRLLQFKKWVPVAQAMPRMLVELFQHPTWVCSTHRPLSAGEL